MTTTFQRDFVAPSRRFPLSSPSTSRLALRVGSFLTAVLLLGGLSQASCSKKEPSASPEGSAGTHAAPPAVPKEYRFAFITNNSADFWNIAEKGIRKAEKDFTVKVDIYRPSKVKGELAEQQRFLEDVLVKGYDGAAVSAVNADALTATLDRVAAKMPLVCHDSDAPTSKRSAYVGTNNVLAGRAAGKAAVEAVQAAGIKKGKVGLFVGEIDASNAAERKQGIDETLGKVAGLEILPVFLDHTDPALAKKNVEDALARHPDLAVMIGLWSYNGPSMAGVVRASNRKKKPILVAFDEDEQTLRAIKEGVISASVVQKPFQIGYQATQALRALKDGKPAPAVLDTGITLVSKANLDSFKAEPKK